jgi:hypothetical protein
VLRDKERGLLCSFVIVAAASYRDRVFLLLGVGGMNKVEALRKFGFLRVLLDCLGFTSLRRQLYVRTSFWIFRLWGSHYCSLQLPGMKVCYSILLHFLFRPTSRYSSSALVEALAPP